MFFSSLEELKNILKNTGTVVLKLEDQDVLFDGIFNLDDFSRELKNTVIIRPGTAKNTSGKTNNFITVEQIRDVINMTISKQTKDFYVIFDHAETIREEGENTMLKLLEEPKDNYHYILLTDTPEALLPTIKSRAEIYTPLTENALEQPPRAPKDVLELSKRLLMANTRDVIDITEVISKKKPDERREYALYVLKTTIELATKSYYKTKNQAFLKKLDGLTKAYENVKLNGNLKLQIVANLC